MPVDFFTAHHTQSRNQRFGLYDKPNPAKEPAFIMEDEDTKWIGVVKNPNAIVADFYGLDHSILIPIPPPNPDNKYIEKMCDGMLAHNNELTFVELKERIGSGKWIGDATKQILSSIRQFAIHHNINQYDKITARICNRLKPQTNRNCANSMQDFREELRKLNFRPGEPMEFTVQQEFEI